MFIFFFFSSRRRHTRFDCDWSSDVCSSDLVLVNGALRRRTPDGAALLRLLMTLGTPTTRRAASRALAELTGEGIYPPEWVTEIGKVTPGQAWRRYDVFGDDEAMAVTFSYGETEHGIVVQVDLAGIPV